jgi:proline dehydrogenase
MPVQLPVKTETEFKIEVAPGTGSTAPSIVDSIPLKLVLWLAAPYLAGQTCEDAVRKAHQIYQSNRFASTIDILGEDCTNDSDCEAFVEAYKHVVDTVSSMPLPCSRASEQMTVSLKPSMFATDVPTNRNAGTAGAMAKAYDRIKTVVEYALKRGVRMTIEAEDHRWTDFHLDTYFSLLNAGCSNVGTVLQSRLFRTKDDVKRFDERGRVRMVIGIYNEPGEIAYTDKAIMKDRLIDYCAELAARGTYVELATHDSNTLGKFFTQVAIPQRLSASQFETQYLLGVPRLEVQQALVSGQYFAQLAEKAPSAVHDYLGDLARTGTVVRMYLPYGKDQVAGPYCKRRLRGNPNMIAYGIKNFLHIKN